jgi:hypothetical protein
MPDGMDSISFDSSHKVFLKQYQLLSMQFVDCDARSCATHNSTQVTAIWRAPQPSLKTPTDPETGRPNEARSPAA